MMLYTYAQNNTFGTTENNSINTFKLFLEMEYIQPFVITISLILIIILLIILLKNIKETNNKLNKIIQQIDYMLRK